MTGTQVSLEQWRGTLRAAEQPTCVRNFLFRAGNAGITGMAVKALAGEGGDARWGHRELCPSLPKEWQHEVTRWGCTWGCGTRHPVPSGGQSPSPSVQRHSRNRKPGSESLLGMKIGLTRTQPLAKENRNRELLKWSGAPVRDPGSVPQSHHRAPRHRGASRGHVAGDQAWDRGGSGCSSPDCQPDLIGAAGETFLISCSIRQAHHQLQHQPPTGGWRLLGHAAEAH